ncbi:glycosyltransferase family 4 protein [Parapedobacter deserti]|uniref:Glycosyltransferase family 4 protein n=1 Tax=Parapedobacter deserti TaxID=1912957 RepID=A0ABV7JLY0_9SPHI
MKILILSHKFYPDIGGIEVNSEVLATEFHRLGMQVRLVTHTTFQGEERMNFPVIRNPSMLDLIRQITWADVVFENNPSLRLSWPALIFPKKKRVVAVRTFIRRTDGRIAPQDKLKRLSVAKANGIIAVSEAIKKSTHPKCVVIGNPYRKDLFRKMSAIHRNKAFAFVGRLVSDKGADMAIQLVRQLKQDEALWQASGLPGTTGLKLTIIGDGPEKSPLEQLVQRLNLTDLINFTGPLKGDELVRTLNEHHFILVPSKWEEPFGNVALEGMACGCIPIVSDGGGLPDAVGSAGITFKRNDQHDFFLITKALIEDEQKRNQLQESSSKHLANHCPEVVAKRYLAVIKHALTQ